MDQLTAVVIIGLASGMVFALIGAGLTLVIGVTDIVDFVHGQFIVAGAMLVVLQYHNVGFYGAAVLGVIVAVAIGAVIYLGALQFTFGNHLQGLLVSLGLVLVLSTLVQQHFSVAVRSGPDPVPGTFQVGSIPLTNVTLVVLGVSVLVCIALYAVLRFTWTGVGLRAMGADRFAAQALSVRVGRAGLAAMTIGAALGGVAGVMYAMQYPVTPLIGNAALFNGFTVAIIGGFGSIEGSMAGGIVYGLVASLSARYLNAGFAAASGPILMAAVLLWRPEGLFRRRTIRVEGA